MIKLLVGTCLVLFGSQFALSSHSLNSESSTKPATEPLKATESRNATPVDDFMKAKLKHSTTIVEGLSIDDFDKIGSAADALLKLSQEAEWNELKTDDYLKMSDEFRASTGRLKKAAMDKNLDGATLAYFEVTLNCVRCHKYVRNLK